MKNRPAPVTAGIVALVLVWGVLWPGDLRAIDEDDLKTAGIISGITLGVGLAIVLIAGTLKDLKGDDEEEEEFLSYAPRQHPTSPGSGLHRFLGKGFKIEDWFSPAQRPALPALPNHLALGELPQTEPLNALPPRAGQHGKKWLENKDFSSYSEIVPEVLPLSR